MLTSDFDFTLPPELIAQQPFFPREKTKMLAWDGKEILDSSLRNLADFLQEGDVMILNDVKVIKAKMRAMISRNSAELDFNLDQQIAGQEDSYWKALCRPAKKVQVGDVLKIAEDFSAEVLTKTDDGFIEIRFDCRGEELLKKIDRSGSIPLPPYIKRAETIDDDVKNYQTIYAEKGVAVAAPTAGLHFTQEIFEQLESKKIKKAFVTLNVGAGTFLPVRSENLKDHKMHSEFFSLSTEAAEIINSAKRLKKRIVAVGTTSLRVLESAAEKDLSGEYFVKPSARSTEIFIYPPYNFKITDVLMTNFHLPKSTLFMLVCAFVGKEKAFEIYNHAISKGYKFYSYGDTSILFRSN